MSDNSHRPWENTLVIVGVAVGVVIVAMVVVSLLGGWDLVVSFFSGPGRPEADAHP